MVASVEVCTKSSLNAIASVKETENDTILMDSQRNGNTRSFSVMGEFNTGRVDGDGESLPIFLRQ